MTIIAFLVLATSSSATGLPDSHKQKRPDQPLKKAK